MATRALRVDALLLIIIRITFGFTLMYVCICNPVTESDVRGCVSRGACTLPELQAQLGVALQCGMCASAVLAIVEEMTGDPCACDRSRVPLAA
jgi:bacterioferritin-associated ferredoxin